MSAVKLKGVNDLSRAICLVLTKIMLRNPASSLEPLWSPIRHIDNHSKLIEVPLNYSGKTNKYSYSDAVIRY